MRDQCHALHEIQRKTKSRNRAQRRVVWEVVPRTHDFKSWELHIVHNKSGFLILTNYQISVS